MKKQFLTIPALVLLLACPAAFALDQIVRPYQSVRGSGMGGLRITTGLYDENFFGNPARATANPKFRFTLMDPMIEVNTNAIDRVSDFTSAGDTLQKFGNATGDNHHVRVQSTTPSIYFPVSENGKWAFAFGLLSSTQGDLDLRNSFRVDPQFVFDAGPAFTLARRFMDGERLSVGMTSHLMYRVSTSATRSMADLLRTSTFKIKEIGGDGAMIDFDLGATYEMPFRIKGFNFQSSVVINSLMDGRFSNVKLTPANTGNLPRPQPRTLGLGMSARRDSLWKLSNVTFGVEFTDIGNNDNGSMFRTIHIGSEARYGVLLPRLGINQGYFTAGLGLDLRFFTIEYAYYTEEMSLNPGLLPDHRHALKIALQI